MNDELKRYPLIVDETRTQARDFFWLGFGLGAVVALLVAFIVVNAGIALATVWP